MASRASGWPVEFLIPFSPFFRSAFVLQHYGGKRGKDDAGPAVRRTDHAKIALVAAAVNPGIAVEHFTPVSIVRQGHAIMIVKGGCHVADDRDRRRSRSLSQPGEDRIPRVIDDQPA